MKRIIIRIAILLVVFVGTAVGVSFYLNQDTVSTTQTMKAASFPLVYMTNGGSQLNCLHGYVKEMDVTAMRDTLTPLEDDRSLSIQIETFDNKIGDLTFEVMSSDGTEVLERTKVNQTEQSGEYINAVLDIQTQLLINTEYVLKLNVSVGEKTLYYYTRLIYESNLHTKDYLDFATGFYERCVNKNGLDEISAYIEPDETGDNTTLAFTNIHSTMDQLSFASLSPTAYYKPIPSLKEINETTATIVMDYMVSAQSDSGETELYYVSEYYRMLYTEERIRLLDFERTMQEIFDPEKEDVLMDGGINLGIAGRDINYKSDSSGSYYAFVQAGALWMYRMPENELVQVFSFPQESGSDARDTYDQNEITIVDIDDGGNMYFLVSGYMNRGEHEGESGVAVYYYDAATYTIRECLFVDTKRNYELLVRDVNSLAYISQDRTEFFILVDGSIYAINLETRQTEILSSGIAPDCFVSSDTGAHAAWLKENEAYGSRTIVVMDLDTRETTEISCEDTEYIRLLGFMGEDVIYGIADAADVNTEHEGMEQFPMKEIVIANAAGEVQLDYSQSGYYVMGVTLDDKMITMARATKENGEFVDADEDHIVNSAEEESRDYGISTYTTTRKQTETVLNVNGSLASSDTPQIIRCSEVIQEGSRTIILETSEKEDVYYVYAKGRLKSVYTSIGAAVKDADENLGVVVDGSMQNVWERGNKETKITLDISTIPDIMKECSLDPAAIEEGTGCTALDLSGCTLDSVLYYVSQGTPVVAKTPVTDQTPQGVVLIIGYDEYNTLLVNPGESEFFYYGINDSTALFEEAGNIFMTYWDPIS